jgi:CheY-like chemotaxis protein
MSNDSEPHAVVLVDDDSITRELFHSVLDHYGVNLHSFSDPHQALEFLQTHVPSAIVTDLFLPEMDGYRVRAAIRKMPHLDACPILVTTAFYTTDSIGELTSNGFEACLLKPIEPRSLFQVLVAYINGAGDDGSISSATSPA